MLRSLSAAKEVRPDIVHAHDLDTLPVGLLISRLHGIPLVYDAHERYAKMIAMDVPGAVSRAVERFEQFLLPRVDLAITINEAMAAELEKHTRNKVLVIMNVIELPPRSKVKEHRSHEAIVLFNPVTFEPMRYIEESMAAMSTVDHCILRLAGSGRLLPAVEKAAKEHDNIEFLGHLPFNKLLEEYNRVDAVLILLNPANENYRTGTANKLGECMAFGLPILVSRRTLNAEIVEREGCGVSFEWSEDNFRQAIDRVRDHRVRAEMGRKGREAAEREYNWGTMRERLQEAYARLLARAQS